ncbi:glycosyltransferase family 2 protein [Sulfitobacter sabulilitoris]|uniref:Glycosyltransferase family 2 protein n=1 Tax=Sulfitobacter sabulilitoris TaxID=2562655 RepID=A0A5S3P7X4_9RHOB|nr:glycosyltransferase family 2 protein [Sulfitobacter sabulilitoris]TMM49555.1 glycosyltransferase family 2 protein [Sulfitobacter sabulilitoris]
MSISTLIMTLNEEENLGRCLDSLKWCDDIVVLDSCSTDRTVEIARAAGARVVQHAYESELEQRMFGLTQIEFRHNWVYTPDADEVTPDDLREEMLAISADPTRREAIFQARYKNMFMGRWIRRSSLYPTWITRMVRPELVRFERKVHSRCVSDHPTGRLKSHFIHYSFNKGLSAWYDKHNRYSSVEASLALSQGNHPRIAWEGLVSGDPADRRASIKAIAARLPFRPTLRFVYMYLLRGGFLDGWAGYTYCRMIASYELMIEIKTEERRRRDEGLPI